MHRQPPIRRKEILYRRSYVDHVNDRFDEDFARQTPIIVVRNHKQEPSRIVLVNHCDAQTEELINIHAKVDDLLKVVQRAVGSRAEPPKIGNDGSATAGDQTKKVQEICERLDKLERQRKGQCSKTSSKSSVAVEEYANINKKVEELFEKQHDLQEKVDRLSCMGSESVDEMLACINDTRCDLEEKISNTQILSEQKSKNLEHKIDQLQVQQELVAKKVDDLTKTIMSLTFHSPSEHTEVTRSPRSKSASSQNSSSETILAGYPEHRKPSKAASLELLYKSKEFDVDSLKLGSTSSGSLIEPLQVESRRASQPALYTSRGVHL